MAVRRRVEVDVRVGAQCRHGAVSADAAARHGLAALRTLVICRGRRGCDGYGPDFPQLIDHSGAEFGGGDSGCRGVNSGVP